jgi:hypothetical protein
LNNNLKKKLETRNEIVEKRKENNLQVINSFPFGIFVDLAFETLPEETFWTPLLA